MKRMGSITPNPKKRSYLLPKGCKNLIDLLHQGAPVKPSLSRVRVNGQIRTKEVRVIGEHGEQLGIMPLTQALQLAQSHSIDLVEIAPRARPPVCRVVDYGRFRYELSRRRRIRS